jgi:hypothetical protein
MKIFNTYIREFTRLKPYIPTLLSNSSSTSLNALSSFFLGSFTKYSFEVVVVACLISKRSHQNQARYQGEKF